MKHNVENIERLSRQLRDVHISDDDFDEDDVLLLDYATEIATTMPELLAGDYQERLATVKKLTRVQRRCCRRKADNWLGCNLLLITHYRMIKKKRGWNGI